MKTAYELAMEKLRRQDAERGESQEQLTPAQRDQIAEIRKVCQAKLAEREILHQAEIRKAYATGEPEAVSKVEEDYRRDRARLEEDAESRVRDVRAGKGKKTKKR